MTAKGLVSCVKAYVHAPGMRHAKEVRRAGADGLVHSATDAPLDDEFITLMKKNGAAYTTTLALYTAFSDVAAWMRDLAAMDTRGPGPKDVYARYQSSEAAKPATPMPVRRGTCGVGAKWGITCLTFVGRTLA